MWLSSQILISGDIKTREAMVHVMKLDNFASNQLEEIKVNRVDGRNSSLLRVIVDWVILSSPDRLSGLKNFTEFFRFPL